MQYFKLSEFETNGQKITNKDIEYNIEYLVDNLLDKVRKYYGKPIYVLEGFNPSSIHNGHTVGIAADITTKSKQGNIDIFEYIKTLKFDELEVVGDYDRIHVSLNPNNRGNILENKQEDSFMTDYIVCLESGHGINVSGKRSPDGRLLEWEWTREIKYRLAELLENNRIALCFDVNPEDTEPGLTVRANRANAVWEKNNKKAIFVSIHVNAAGSGTWTNARGWSVFVSPSASKASKELAQTLYSEAENLGLKGNRSVPKEKYWIGNFTVLNKTKCPAVLTENMFQDNKDDVEYLLSEKGKEEITNLHFEGIRKFLLSNK